ncbi:hypothetical protein COCCU_09965 [Corynebacterium occultum]|uniref:Uncharacterized protein n=1 Tax=Corynebacterium occultum TaxID=2675219 RepID=A0A6B8VQR6_9CORY|nr:hypothetical protein [Corynebacterium occultum]QGU07912.1 hypothetical protein COCCU_09965 [Corynebacterium occultum]
MLNNPILITRALHSRADLYAALAANTYRDKRPAPANLDAMADLLREFQVSKIICAHWQLREDDEQAVLEVLADLEIELQR